MGKDSTIRNDIFESMIFKDLLLKRQTLSQKKNETSLDQIFQLLRRQVTRTLKSNESKEKVDFHSQGIILWALTRLIKFHFRSRL